VTAPLLATTGPTAMWYLTRGAGMVALILLSASVVLGILTTVRWASPRMPRFVTSGLHRNVSLLALALVVVHIATTVIDGFAPIGWKDAVIPFVSAYRPLWLGLGTLAFDILLALLITSALRLRIGHRAWRVVHWLSYACWPVAVVHGLGTGSDSRSGWALLLTAACVAAVVVAVLWRVVYGWPSHRVGKLVAGAGSVVAPTLLLAWLVTGPLQPGWAKRAGTPASLLAGARTTAASQPQSAGTPPTTASSSLTPPFSAPLQGSITQSGPDERGRTTVQIATTLQGHGGASLQINLVGEALDDGGVAMRSSSVSFGPASDPRQYTGSVTALQGSSITASVSGSGGAMTLSANLNIDQATGSVTGTLNAAAA
jgi:sulfoxide reductase heme-binding subunit YedZ